MGRTTAIAALTRRAQQLRHRGRHAEAVSVLDSAVQAAAAQLADLHGQRGGALRAGGQWGAAIAEYDLGHSLEDRYATGASYNGLNRLLCRLAHRTPAAGESRWPTLDIAAELAALQARLAQRLIAAGPGSAWDVGDLALVAALRGDAPALARSLEALRGTDPPAAFNAAYLATLDMLATAGHPPSRALARLRQALTGAPR